MTERKREKTREELLFMISRQLPRDNRKKEKRRNQNKNHRTANGNFVKVDTKKEYSIVAVISALYAKQYIKKITNDLHCNCQ